MQVTEGQMTEDEVTGDVTNEPTKSVMMTEARESSLFLRKNIRTIASCSAA